MASDRCDLLCLDVPVAEAIRSDLPDVEVVTQLANIAQACADPTRLSLLLALNGEHELCVCDLTWIVDRSQNLVSHHLRKLRETGLVEARREAKIVFYTPTPLGRSMLTALLELEVPA